MLSFIVVVALAGCGGGGAAITGGGGSTAPQAVSSIKLQSDAGDYIGAGQTYSYTKATAQTSVSATGGHLSVSITGDQRWTGDFLLPNTLSKFQPGTYSGLKRYPFNDPAVGGLNWDGEGRGSDSLTGSFTVASVTYVKEVLTAIDLTFEQHSEGAAPALHGHIIWDSRDATAPPGPVNPIPPGLWQPASGSVPSTGNYVYLQSDPGDFIGLGQTYTFTTSQISVSAVGAHLGININTNEFWSGEFHAMNTLDKLQRGYYGDLRRFPFNNPVKGGLDWDGAGRGCNTLTGWFVVDNVTYVNGVLTAIDLRFEQHCEGTSPALHGKIHWIQ